MPLAATDVARQYLAGAGLPQSQTNIAVVAAWLQTENGTGKVNQVYAPGERPGSAANYNNWLGQNYVSGTNWGNPATVPANAQFNSPQEAGAAWGQLLQSNPAYAPIYSSLKAGNAGDEALAALQGTPGKTWGSPTGNIVTLANQIKASMGPTFLGAPSSAYPNITSFGVTQPLLEGGNCPTGWHHQAYTRPAGAAVDFCIPDTLVPVGTAPSTAPSGMSVPGNAVAAAGTIGNALLGGVSGRILGAVIMVAGFAAIGFGVYIIFRSSTQEEAQPDSHAVLRQAVIFRE